jgi:hypothetical protein
MRHGKVRERRKKAGGMKGMKGMRQGKVSGGGRME